MPKDDILYYFWVDEYPDTWDETLFFTALQILRCDPSSAHGFSPAQLLLGRPVVYPMQLRKRDIDFEGNCIVLLWNQIVCFLGLKYILCDYICNNVLQAKISIFIEAR